jgi:hypothetical protein
MKTKTLMGFIIGIIGLVILLIGSFMGFVGFLGSLVYGLPLIIIGLIIAFNKSEDKIEQPNYSQVKGGLKNGRK